MLPKGITVSLIWGSEDGNEGDLSPYFLSYYSPQTFEEFVQLPVVGGSAARGPVRPPLRVCDSAWKCEAERE